MVEEAGGDTWWIHDLVQDYDVDLLTDLKGRDAVYVVHAAFFRDMLWRIETSVPENWRTLETIWPEVEAGANWLLEDISRSPEVAFTLINGIAKAYQVDQFPQIEKLFRVGLATATSLQKTAEQEGNTKIAQFQFKWRGSDTAKLIDSVSRSRSVFGRRATILEEP